MSLQAVMFVLDRMYKEPGLFHRYVNDPEGTLAHYDLAPDEIEAIISGNRERLIAVGVDERVAGWIIRPRDRERRRRVTGGGT